MPLISGGSRRTVSLGGGGQRSGSLVAGSVGRRKNIPTPSREAVGASAGTSAATAFSDFAVADNRVLQEDGFAVLQEDGSFLLVEQTESFGSASGSATVTGFGETFSDGRGLASGSATVSGQITTTISAGNNLLQEQGDRLLQEDGFAITLEVGVVSPPTTILDVSGSEFLDTSGQFILGVGNA